MDILVAISCAVLSFLGGIAGAYLRSYSAKKGENLATKQDIGELTAVVEDIKQSKARELADLTESLRAHQSMRSAALEKRLEVHQDAYRLALRMLQNVHAEHAIYVGMTVEIREWWMSNALYLDPSPRAAFDAAWLAFIRHPHMLGQDYRADPEDVTKNFSRLEALPPALEDAVELPPIRINRKTQLDAPEKK
jgi:hypothetical protein